MKKPINLLTIALMVMVVFGLSIAGCKKTNENGDVTSGDFDKASSAFVDTRTAPALTVTFPSVIPAGFTFVANRTYIIDGPTYVPSGVTLTIPAGTFIKGKKTSTSGKPSFLLVTKGGRLIANGTQALPIVLTSDQPACSRAAGDWGGLVILGRGITNVPLTTIIEGVDATMVPAGQSTITFPASFEYGGTDNADLAGQSSLKHIRIEFAGDILTADKELNGLTLGAVGSSTTLNNIQVSHGADDGFEFFGGSVNAKYLVSYGNNDDDFDFDQGYQGSIQFAVAVKLACASGYSSNPNGIECNNVTAPVVIVPGGRPTHPILANFTLLGHSATPGPTAGVGALFRAATEFTFVNSLVGGFATGVNYTAAVSPLVYSNSAIHGFTTASTPAAPVSGSTSTAASTNGYLLLSNPFNLNCSCTTGATPDFRFRTSPTASPANGLAVTPAPNVTHPGGIFPTAGSMDDPTYAGALGNTASTRWDAGSFWASYFPQGNTY